MLVCLHRQLCAHFGASHHQLVEMCLSFSRLGQHIIRWGIDLPRRDSTTPSSFVITVATPPMLDQPSRHSRRYLSRHPTYHRHALATTRSTSTWGQHPLLYDPTGIPTTPEGRGQAAVHCNARPRCHPAQHIRILAPVLFMKKSNNSWWFRIDYKVARTSNHLSGRRHGVPCRRALHSATVFRHCPP